MCFAGELSERRGRCWMVRKLVFKPRGDFAPRPDQNAKNRAPLTGSLDTVEILSILNNPASVLESDPKLRRDLVGS